MDPERSGHIGMEIFHAHIVMDQEEFNMTDIDEIQLRELRNQIRDEMDEGILKSLHVDENGVEIISEGGFAHRFCVALVHFYETLGGKNYFTTTVETTVKGERKRYEITIRNLQGEKSPAEVIAELKDRVARLEKGEGKDLLDKLEEWRKQCYEKCRMHNPEFHWVKESECNTMWYSETEFLKKLREKL
jgi:hypothetical protein